MDWKQYEQEILEYFRSAYPGASIQSNAKIHGRFSRIDRQIDVLVENHAADFMFRVIIDGKYRNKKIDVNDVEGFLGLVRDVQGHAGVMVSPEGYTEAAINRAYHDDLDVYLDILNFKDLEMFQGVGAIVHAGSNAVIIRAPFGWIIDANPPKGMLACLYQRGFDLARAGEAREWMYVNIWGRDERTPDLPSLLALQDERLKHNRGAEIKYLASEERRFAITTRLRRFRCDNYPALEYTGFVDFEDFIFFCVLYTPVELEKKNLRKLRDIIRQVLPLKVVKAGSEEADRQV